MGGKGITGFRNDGDGMLLPPNVGKLIDGILRKKLDKLNQFELAVFKGGTAVTDADETLIGLN